MKLDKILIPLSGAVVCERVLGPLTRIVPSHASLWLHQVLSSVPSTDQDLAHAHAYLEGVRSSRGLSGAGCIVGVGRPVDQILMQAMEFGVNLIAMTTSASGMIRELLGGTVSGQVLLRSPVPVLMSGPRLYDPERPIHRILMAIDEPDMIDPMLDVVAPLARELEAELITLHVMSPRPVLIDPSGGMPVLWPPPAPEVRNRLSRRLAAKGVPARSMSVEGDVAEEILRSCASAAPDLIVMMFHPQGVVGQLLEGSPWRRVLQQAVRPVLFVRRPHAP